jgi:hypothetical protein
MHYFLHECKKSVCKKREITVGKDFFILEKKRENGTYFTTFFLDHQLCNKLRL